MKNGTKKQRYEGEFKNVKKELVSDPRAFSAVIFSFLGSPCVLLFDSPFLGAAVDPCRFVLLYFLIIFVSGMGFLSVYSVFRRPDRCTSLLSLINESFGDKAGFLYLFARIFCLRTAMVGLSALVGARYLCELARVSDEVTLELLRPISMAGICIIIFLNLIKMKNYGIVERLCMYTGLVSSLTLVLAGFYAELNADSGESIVDIFSCGAAFSGSSEYQLVSSIVLMMPSLWIAGGWEDLLIQKDGISCMDSESFSRVIRMGFTVLGISLLIFLGYFIILTPDEMARVRNIGSFSVFRVFGKQSSVFILFMVIIFVFSGMWFQIKNWSGISRAALERYSFFRFMAGEGGPDNFSEDRVFLLQGAIAFFTVWLSDNIFDILKLLSVVHWSFSIIAVLSVIKKQIFDEKLRFKVHVGRCFPGFAYVAAATWFVFCLVIENLWAGLAGLGVVGCGGLICYSQDRIFGDSSEV